MAQKKMDHVLRMRAPLHLKERLERVAAARGISSSDVAREGINKHLDSEEQKLVPKASEVAS